MSRTIISFLLSGVATAFLSTANAAPRYNDPLVIPGVGAEPLIAPPPPLTAPIEPPPEMRMAIQSRARAVNAQRPMHGGGYGGGFLEMIFSGDPGTARRATYNNLQPSSALAQPGATQVAAYAPNTLEARRTVPAEFLRTEVELPSRHAPGTIVVDTPNKYLYLVQGGGRATRYGIGVGRPGFTWSGVKTISRKAEWPAWTPPAEMLRRRPDLPRHMQGGPENPLGARAMYLGSSLYRIHGTNEPYTIGQNVSSGCIRMMNEDVTDLYGRVGVGTKVIVM